MTEALALYTVIHEGAIDYLPAWSQSVKRQSDKNFELLITLDGVNADEVEEICGGALQASWLSVANDDSPVQARQSAIEQMCDKYRKIVFVDADDILEDTRIEGARKALEHSDLNGCSMRIIDKRARDTGVLFQPDNKNDLSSLLVTNNVFGLTNSAYKTDILRKCLPIPASCKLVDWFIAFKASLLGARLSFDHIPRMKYRQYETNTAKVLPPFNKKYIEKATDMVLGHYDLFLSLSDVMDNDMINKIKDARNRIFDFRSIIIGSNDRFDKYELALNDLTIDHIWWSCVAHPRLEKIWKN